MFMKKLITLMKRILLTAMLLSMGTLQAESGQQRLNHFISNVNTFEAIFTQEVVSEDGVVSQPSVGKLLLSRPGQFNWEYQKPFPQQIIADGRNVWIYDPGLEQVTVKPLSEALGSTPVALLTQKGDIRQNFDLKDSDDRESLSWVELRPKGGDGDFKRILIGLDHEGIKGMDLYDQFGQVTMIRFHETHYNESIPAARFKFTPPKGVDVIGQPS
jgi:outer membrane lipoprotein carrier protein